MKSFAKKTLLAAAVAMGTSSVSIAAPLISIGDSVDVFFVGSTNAQWRSNLFYTDGIDNTDTAILFPPGTVNVVSRPKESAFVFYVSPGLEVNIGRNSNANLSIYFREDFLFYSKYHSELNTELANLFIDGSYDFGNLTTRAGFSFVQEQQNSPSTNGYSFVANLVETNNLRAYASASYDISPKAWVSGGFEWRETDYTNNDEFFNRYANLDVYEAPLTFFWRVTPKLSVGPSFRFRYSDTGESGGFAGIVGGAPVITGINDPANYYDYFFNLAVDGEVLPKLSVGINVGYQFRDPDTDAVFYPVGGLFPVVSPQDQRHQFAIDANAEYEITPKLLSYVNFSNDFGVGAEGQTTTNLGGDVGLRYQYNSYLSSDASFGMVNIDYQDSLGRNDLTTTTGFSVTYTPDVYWRLSAGYYYINNKSRGDMNPATFSDNTGASFQAHTVNLQATFRY